MFTGTTTYTSTHGLTFTIRTMSAGDGKGHIWTVIAEDHPYRKSSARRWANTRLATAAAIRHIERTFA